MLISARIDYRHRLESSFAENLWIQDILVYSVDSFHKLYFKNLNQMIPVKFCLIDSTNLVSIFPNCESVFVKMC